MKINSSNYSGYLWYSNADMPKVYEGEKIFGIELKLTQTKTDDGKLCIEANKDVDWIIDGTANYTINNNKVYITTTSNENIKITATAKDGSKKEMEIQTN